MSEFTQPGAHLFYRPCTYLQHRPPNLKTTLRTHVLLCGQFVATRALPWRKSGSDAAPKSPTSVVRPPHPKGPSLHRSLLWKRSEIETEREREGGREAGRAKEHFLVWVFGHVEMMLRGAELLS